jgi:hypothetical protein
MRKITNSLARILGRRQSKVAILIIALVLVTAGCLYWKNSTVAQEPPQLSGPYVITKQSNPFRTVVKDSDGHWLATFTNESRTVTLLGPSRTFAEPQSTGSTITHNTWVRVLPQPFAGKVDQAWLRRELTDNSPDILAIAMQYIDKARPIHSGDLTIAGDASYGPLENDKRKEGSDFNDYLGITQKYGTVADAPEPLQKGSMDCSGYMRMVWGYRAGLPLDGPNSVASSAAIPRRAFQIQAAAPGIVLVPDTQKQATEFKYLNIGDIVFFDANANDGRQIDHNGMYMGRDSRGHYRFISSRKTADGPTLGDIGGVSILDGHGLYAKSFRSIRRF